MKACNRAISGAKLYHIGPSQDRRGAKIRCLVVDLFSVETTYAAINISLDQSLKKDCEEATCHSLYPFEDQLSSFFQLRKSLDFN